MRRRKKDWRLGTGVCGVIFLVSVVVGIHTHIYIYSISLLYGRFCQLFFANKRSPRFCGWGNIGASFVNCYFHWRLEFLSDVNTGSLYCVFTLHPSHNLFKAMKYNLSVSSCPMMPFSIYILSTCLMSSDWFSSWKSFWSVMTRSEPKGIYRIVYEEISVYRWLTPAAAVSWCLNGTVCARTWL